MQKDQKGNYVLGAGEIFFAQRMDDGTMDGYRYIRETPSFSLNITAETVELWGSDSETAQKISSTETQRDMTATVQAHDVDQDNLALFFAADDTEVDQADDAVVDENLTVRPGRSFRLGTGTTPRGFRNVSSVAVTGPTGSPVYVNGEDFEVDERRGLLSILEGGDIGESTDVEVSYDHADVSYRLLNTTGKKSVTGAILFKARNSTGQNIDYELPNVVIRPDGDFALKSRDDYQALSYTIEVLEDDEGNSIYIEGEPVETPA